MYQLLFDSTNGNGSIFAANIPEKEVSFIEHLCDFNALPFSVSVYDTKVTAKEYEDYGKFRNKKAFMKWLFEIQHSFKTMEEFENWYNSYREDYNTNKKIEDIVTDILYEDFFTACNTMTIWKKIRCTVMDMHYEFNRPLTKRNLMFYTKRALADCVLNA